MTESEIRERYAEDRPIYDAYGEFLKETLTREIKREVDSRDFGDLFKVEPNYRVKEIDSLVAKALYRGKSYQNPYEDITDKVGVRFVFLLQSQLEEAANLIEDAARFEVEKPRDYREQRRNNPTSFEYQSTHYVLRPERGLTVEDGITVPRGTPCELQLRTLLQHAYSELTHDTVYKPRLVATPEMRRVVAKSMALIETTGDMFGSVEDKLQDMDEQFRHITEVLEEIYEQFGTPEYRQRVNDFLLRELLPLLEELPFDLDEVAEFYDSTESDAIIQFVRERSADSLLYRQPVILLVAYLVKEYQYEVPKYWPLTREELEPIYSQLGKSLSGSGGAAIHQ